MTPANESVVSQAVIPGHVAAGELAREEHTIAIDGVTHAGVAERQLDGGMLGGSVLIIPRLARQHVFRRDQDVPSARGFGGPLLDRRIRAFPGVQHDQRRIVPKRMIFRRQAHGVIGGLVVLVQLDAMKDRFLGGGCVVVPRRRHELDDPSEQLQTMDHSGVGSPAAPGHSRLSSFTAWSLRNAESAPARYSRTRSRRLPESLRALQLGDGELVAHDISRHRQGEPRLVRHRLVRLEPSATRPNGRGPRPAPARSP